MTPETLGRRIRRLRLALQLSQEQLAQRVPVASRTVSAWERDENAPRSFPQQRALANALGVSVATLLGVAEASVPPTSSLPSSGGDRRRPELQPLREAVARVSSYDAQGASPYGRLLPQFVRAVVHLAEDMIQAAARPPAPTGGAS